MRPLSDRLRRRAPGYELPNTASIEDWALTPRRPGLLLPACLLFLAALNSRNQRCSWMAWLGLGELGELGEMGSSGGEVRQGTRSRRCRRERHTELTCSAAPRRWRTTHVRQTGGRRPARTGGQV